MSLYLVTTLTDLSIPYEPVNEGSLDLIGVFTNKKAIDKALKKLELKHSSVQILKIEPDKIAYDPDSMYCNGLTSLYGWEEYYNDYYEDPMDI